MTRPTLRLTERIPREVRLAPRLAWELMTSVPKRIEIEPGRETGNYRITSLGLVGELILPSMRVVIRPKIPLANLAFLLDAELPRDWHRESEMNPTVELLALAFLKQLDEHLRNGLTSQYVESTHQQAFLQGRLDVAAQLRDSSPVVRHFHVEREELTEDHDFNQYLKGAINHLQSVECLSGDVRQRLRDRLRNFTTVSDRSPRDLLHRLPVLPNLSPESQSLFEFCLTILEGGRIGSSCLVDLESVFEKFLIRRLRSFPALRSLGVDSDRRIHFVGESGHPPLYFKPDVVLGNREKPTCVLDTKWKQLEDAPDADDVQQVIAYGAMLGVKDVRLIYPGKRFATREYPIPATGMKLRIHTLRVIGSLPKCDASMAKFLRSLLNS